MLWDVFYVVKCEPSEIGLLSRISCFVAGSDDDAGVLFMALMAHDTTKFDGVMRAREDAGNKPDFPDYLNRTKKSLGLTALAALVYIGLLKAAALTS